MSNISRRTALATGAAAITTGAIAAPLAIKAAGVKEALAGDTELIALGQQWVEVYTAWLQCNDDDDRDTVLMKRAIALEGRIAEIPSHSPSGALVKLRVVAENLRLMGELDGSCRYVLLTYQAWQSLETEPIDFERIMRETPS